MASFPVSLRATAAILVLCIYFLCFAHAAFIIDGNGMREVNISQILQNAGNARSPPQPPPTCTRGDTLVRVGTKWQERCRECTCTETGTQCTGPTCALPYDPMQEVTCAKFADDCCCAQEGCLLEDGRLIPIGGAMPFDSAKPCNSCTCSGGNRTRCRIRTCSPFECVDSVRREGQCCPDCPNGRTCVLPFSVRRSVSRLELLSKEPVREFYPVTLNTGSPYEVTCTCQGNLVAKCVKTSLPNPIFDMRRFNIVA